MSYFNCFDLSNYQCGECTTPENGRIVGVAFVYSGIDVESVGPVNSPETWFQLHCNDLALIIPEVRGDYDGGSVVEGPGYGTYPTRKTSSNHTLNFMKLFDCSNIELFNDLSKNSGQFELWFATQSLIFRSGFNKTVSIDARFPITDDINSNIEWNFTIKWSSIDLPRCYEKPAGIFDRCSDLNNLANCYTCLPIDPTPCP